MEPRPRTLYVLLLNGGRRYVGVTDDLDRRLQEHRSGDGAAWTRAHGYVRLERSEPLTSAFEEDKVVKELMATHGIDTVRGGVFSSLELPAEQERQLERELRHAAGRCLRCGREGHLIASCVARTQVALPAYGGARVPQQRGRSRSRSREREPLRGGYGGGGASDRVETSATCTRCGHHSHNALNCYASTHEDGRPLDRGAGSGRGERAAAQAPSSGACFRCGRQGHFSDECYASSHVLTHRRLNDSDDDDDDEDDRRGRGWRVGGWRGGGGGGGGGYSRSRW